MRNTVDNWRWIDRTGGGGFGRKKMRLHNMDNGQDYQPLKVWLRSREQLENVVANIY